MTNPFRDPGIADGEKSVYSVRVGEGSQGTELVSLIEHDADSYLSSVETGSADSFSVKVEQRIRRAAGKMEIDSYKAETLFEDRLVSREEGYFAGTQHLQFGGELKPYPKGVMPLIGGLTLLRGLDFQRGAKSKLDLWLGFSICWPLEAKVEKRTRVDIAGGSFDAWQVRIRPGFSHINSLLDKVIAGFLPPFVAHFEAGGSHRLVRFSFPSGPLPWNPRGVLELAS